MSHPIYKAEVAVHQPESRLISHPLDFIIRVGEVSVYIAQRGKGYIFYESTL